ncbi:hypothetical protein [Motilibacter deserti]|uniref:Fibronectin type-III domain-containing protein n=1 Tax=Motilibacter deserti TaxID=2714956 RepID=A0ABX0GNV6_9ACTN|nr:hypothetical protein [Motilibacter deserti]NHC12523.1 hypothetical protein [Motilibacter deserti]
MSRNVTRRHVASLALVTVGVTAGLVGTATTASAKRLPVATLTPDVVTTASAPAAPTVTGSAVSSAGYTLRFTDNADDETGFRMQKSTDYGTTWVDVEGTDTAALEGTGGYGMVRTPRAGVGFGTQLRVVAVNETGIGASDPRTCC